MDPLPDYDPLDDSFDGEDDEKVCIVHWPPGTAHYVKYSLGLQRATGRLTLLVHSTGERYDLSADDPGVVDPSGKHQLATFRPPTNSRGGMSRTFYKDADAHKRVEIILCFKIATAQAQAQPPQLAAPPIISRPRPAQQQQQQLNHDEAAASVEIINGDDRNDDDARWGGDGESFNVDPPVGVGGVLGGGDDGSDEQESLWGGDVQSFVGVDNNYSPGDVDVSVGGGSESLLEELQKAREEAQEASRVNEQLKQEKMQLEQEKMQLEQEKMQWQQEKMQWQQEMKSLQKEKKEYQIRHLLLESENDHMEEKVATLEKSLSAAEALHEYMKTVHRELLLEVKNLKGAQVETEDRLDAVEASADENREDVGNLKNDVEGLATEHQELAGNFEAEIQRRELKEYDIDNNNWKLSKDVEDVRTHVDDTADELRKERREELDDTEENIKKESLASVNEEFSPEIDDHKENIQRLENDLSNMKDELQELKDRETGNAVTGQATVTRHRSRRVKVLSLQTRNRNGASRQR